MVEEQHPIFSASGQKLATNRASDNQLEGLGSEPSEKGPLKQSKAVEANFVAYCNPFDSRKLCGSFELERSAYSLEAATSVDDDPPGLTGLRNVGNTCYMNAALQALSNCPQLVEYLRNCRLPPSDKPSIVSSYRTLVNQMWDDRRLPFANPSGILNQIRIFHSVFRGYQQQDAQEFLRCFLDELHESLKVPVYEWECQGELLIDRGRKSFDSSESYSETSSIESFQTCDSGWSSDQEGRRTTTNRRRRSRGNRLAFSESFATEDLAKSDSSDFSDAVQEVASAQSFRRRTLRCNPDLRRKPIRYRSVISDLFDGKLLSSVQCLTCNSLSNTEETFQDLSLPIPSREQLQILRSHAATSSAAKSPDSRGYLSWLLSWLQDMVVGVNVSLEDCLKAFFSPDDLKGDDMYRCDRCKKLRNGVKLCRLLKLPEVLSIHLKRFRHDLFYSSKVSSTITFPLEGLDLRSFIHKDCSSSVTEYDLLAVICHHGSFEVLPFYGVNVDRFSDDPYRIALFHYRQYCLALQLLTRVGHYTAYCLNHMNYQWYEFDDQTVTPVDAIAVQNAEAYVLFYGKTSKLMDRIREEFSDMLVRNQPSLMKFCISYEWIVRFNTFAEPGPITNFDFLCPHGYIAPEKAAFVNELFVEIPDHLWHFLYSKFGGGPVCSQLFSCCECQQYYLATRVRNSIELESFLKLQREFENEKLPTLVYGLSMKWFARWKAFVLNQTTVHPGPIDNACIAKRSERNDGYRLRPESDHCPVSRDLWKFFHSTYGGGPELLLCGSTHAAIRSMVDHSLRSEDFRSPISVTHVSG